MRFCGPTLLAIFVVAAASLTSGFQRSSPKYSDAPPQEFEPSIPHGISRSLWRSRIPRDNPLTQAKVSLGEMLYFDKRLSADGTVSCATCHDPANAFTDHRTVAVGVWDKPGTRNAPTILNAMFIEQLFWDGRAGSLEEQASQPLANPIEMAMGGGAVISRLSTVPEYRQRFRQVFGDEGITIKTVVKSIAAYERTLLSANSPFDRFLTGDRDAISAAQKRGWVLFKGKAKCIECHSFTKASPFFTDFKFHNTGIVARELNPEILNTLAKKIANRRSIEESAPILAHTQGFTELGRYLVTRQPEDLGAFRTPGLRDVELTSPYMHNGSEKTLIDVVRFYNRGGNESPNRDKRIISLGLTDAEMNDLVEFMRALTSNAVLQRTQSSVPQTRIAISFD